MLMMCNADSNLCQLFTWAMEFWEAIQAHTLTAASGKFTEASLAPRVGVAICVV